MADIIVREEGEALVPGSVAHVNYMGILAAKERVGKNFLILGRLLKKNRDEKHFVELGYDTFEDFLGAPEVSLSRSMVFDLIRAVEIFLDGLGRPLNELAAIGISKLSAIAKEDPSGSPVVYQDPDEWIGKAQALSRSDLNEEVWEITGRPPVRRSDAPRSTDLKPIGPGEDYVDYVRDSPCCVCGKPSTEAGKSNAAHFPVTRGAGAPKDWVIPLCGECHHEQHQDPVKFMVTYQAKWAAWFYYLIATTGHYDPLQTRTPSTRHGASSTLPDTTEHYTDGLGGTLGGGSEHEGVSKRSERSVSEASVASDTNSRVLKPQESGEAPERLGEDGGVDSPRNASAGFAGSAAVSSPVVGQEPGRVPGGRLDLGPPKRIWPPKKGKKRVGPGEGLIAGSDKPGGTMVQWDTVVNEPKTYDGNFARCSGCSTTWPTADLEGGLCGPCRADEPKGSPVAGLAFPKPVSRKRRGKKGGSK